MTARPSALPRAKSIQPAYLLLLLDWQPGLRKSKISIAFQVSSLRPNSLLQISIGNHWLFLYLNEMGSLRRA